MNGYSFVEPPISAQNQYFMDGSSSSQDVSWSSGKYTKSASANFGHIALNHGKQAVVAFLDGHVALLSLEELRDSRLWSRVAQEKDDPDHVFQR
jgi:prepilin-type processing-associated H-X9-DG protein